MNIPQQGTPLAWRIGIGIAITLLTTVVWFTHETIGPRMQALAGVFCFLGLAAMFSTDLRKVNPRVLITGLLLQVLLAVLVLKVPFIQEGFAAIGRAISKFLDFSLEGAKFVFGRIPDRDVMDASLKSKDGSPAPGFEFFFIALPPVIFVSAFFTILYHLQILQAVVWVFARIMVFLMGKKGVSGAEALSGTANVFMGQTEAPLIVKPYIPKMTKSELLALMIGGMATVSGGVMVAYIQMGANAVALLTTSVMAAPTGLYLAKLLMPETEEPVTRGQVKIATERTHANVVDAAASGASDGMTLVLNIAAMLIAFLALIALINYLLMQIHPTLTLQSIFAIVFSPISLLMGVPMQDVPTVGELLGTKLAANEFVAFADFTSKYKDQMDPRSAMLTAFALTGFANFSSIGIQLGGIGPMAPNRRSDLAELGLKALLGGFLATLINAAIAGVVM